MACKSEPVVIEFLISKGANVNQANKQNIVPLIEIASNTQREKYKYVRHLLENGACVNARDLHGKTALHYLCCDPKYSNVVKLLLSTKDVNFKLKIKDTGDTPLHCAASVAPNFEICKQLIDCGADFLIQNTKGESPLLKAILCQNLQTVEYILDKYIFKDMKLIEKIPIDYFTKILLIYSRENVYSDTLCRIISHLDRHSKTNSQILLHDQNTGMSMV